MLDESPTTGVIVVGYDGSPSSRAAVDLAVDRAGRTGDRLLLVYAGNSGRATLDGILLDGHDRLADLEWEARVVEGPAARGLVRVAEEDGAYEIVVGSRGLGRTGAVLGSVAERLIALAPCPVTVVPSRAAEDVELRLGS